MSPSRFFFVFFFIMSDCGGAVCVVFVAFGVPYGTVRYHTPHTIPATLCTYIKTISYTDTVAMHESQWGSGFCPSAHQEESTEMYLSCLPSSLVPSPQFASFDMTGNSHYITCI